MEEKLLLIVDGVDDGLFCLVLVKLLVIDVCKYLEYVYRMYYYLFNLFIIVYIN